MCYCAVYAALNLDILRPLEKYTVIQQASSFITPFVFFNDMDEMKNLFFEIFKCT